MPSIQLTQVGRVYQLESEQVHALRQVSLELSCGQLVGLMGNSGSGKSTLLNVIAGIDLPDSGEVHINGVQINTQSPRQRAAMRLQEIGMVFQSDNLLSEFTASENVAIILHARGQNMKSALGQAQEALQQVDAAHLASRYPHQLSRGQRQRVGVARALVGGRSILLADEPTAALDHEAGGALFGLFAQLAKQGVLVLVASHDRRIANCSDQCYEISDGQLAVVSP